MNKFEFSIKQLKVYNQDGSAATKANRHRSPFSIGGELHELGFKLKSAHNLKPRNVQAMVTRWKERWITNERDDANRFLVSLFRSRLPS